MSLTAALEKRAIEDSEEIRPKGPYLRLRIQPRRRVSARIVAMCMIAASLLFIKVWERTVANSLSMERDRIAREVRSVENRIRITRDLEEQQALRSGLDLTSLSELGFQSQDIHMGDDSAPGGRGPGSGRGSSERSGEPCRPF